MGSTFAGLRVSCARGVAAGLGVRLAQSPDKLRATPGTYAHFVGSFTELGAAKIFGSPSTSMIRATASTLVTLPKSTCLAAASRSATGPKMIIPTPSLNVEALLAFSFVRKSLILR